VIDQERQEQRVLVLVPTIRDARLTASLLDRAGVACDCCAKMAELCTELEKGAGAVLLPEEAVIPERDARLTQWLNRQEPWSDLPVLVLARPGADSAAVRQAMDLLGNVTVLERPTRVAALVSAVRTALRARQRQYQIRDYLIERQRAEQALADSDRRKDEFLAILAHELRNPLAPIRSSLHLLRLSSRQDAASERIGQMMERQVSHMVRLVDDLMEVSRISRGKIELRKEPIELAAVVSSAVETSRPLIEAGGQRLALEVPAEPIWLDGDFVRLTQVVANLLNNAAKYSDPAGQIWLAVRREGDEVVISVRDVGEGIPPAMLPRVFDLFMQIDGHSSRGQGGLGIGLTLVKSLVELHGGSVEARSEGTGRGSEFVVRLPMGRARPQLPASSAGIMPVLSSRRIMVVDDNRDAAESIGMILKLLGADVHVEYSGPDALRSMASYQPAVVLLDIGMPGMDGHELARQIRQRPEFRDVTLIALTGWGKQEDPHRFHPGSFDYHLVKPADIETLKDLLLSLEHPTTIGASEPHEE
jgi:signal transduction histidine kinase/ActR/RegA family two-component response regulator